MSNMKYTYKMTVAHGNVASKVLEFVAKDFGRLAADTEDIEDMPCSEHVVGDNRYFVSDRDVDNEQLDIVLTCLDDHIANTPEDELRSRTESLDYMCANPAHTDEVACHCSLPDCYHTEVYEHVYYGPNCVVTCYYVVQI